MCMITALRRSHSTHTRANMKGGRAAMLKYIKVKPQQQRSCTPCGQFRCSTRHCWKVRYMYEFNRSTKQCTRSVRYPWVSRCLLFGIPGLLAFIGKSPTAAHPLFPTRQTRTSPLHATLESTRGTDPHSGVMQRDSVDTVCFSFSSTHRKRMLCKAPGGHNKHWAATSDMFRLHWVAV